MDYSPFLEAKRRCAPLAQRGTALMLVRQSGIIRMGPSETPINEGTPSPQSLPA